MRRAIRDGRWPDSERTWEVFDELWRQYLQDSQVVTRMLRSYRFAVSEGREPWTDMVDVWIKRQERIVTDEADRMCHSSDEVTRGAASTWVAGYVDAHPNIWKNRRIFHRLGPGSRYELRRRLALELPGAILTAWLHKPVYGDLKRLKTEVGRILEGLEDRRYRPPRRGPRYEPAEIERIIQRLGFEPGLSRPAQPSGGLHPAPRSAGGDERADSTARARRELQEVEARELAARLSLGDFELVEAVNELKDKYGLSDQQARVAYVCQEHPDWTLRQVGEALGVAEGTVKAHRYAIRSKLERPRSA
jgi:hypothetical protein